MCEVGACFAMNLCICMFGVFLCLCIRVFLYLWLNSPSCCSSVRGWGVPCPVLPPASCRRPMSPVQKYFEIFWALSRKYFELFWALYSVFCIINAWTCPEIFWSVLLCIVQQPQSRNVLMLHLIVQCASTGCFFLHWYPLKKLQVQKSWSRLGSNLV